MSQEISYIDFFKRHSFGEVPILVYDEFIPGDSIGGFFKLKSPESDMQTGRTLAYLIPENYFEMRRGDAVWRKFDVFKSAIVSGTLVEGEIIREDDSFLVKADKMVSGGLILSRTWGEAGIRHIDFNERAVPVPDEEEGFQDYVRRWRERELKDQGIIKDNLDSDEYNSKFMTVHGPIRYHLFLSEEETNEPECYFDDKKVFLPKACPAFEDLLVHRIEKMHGDSFWGPVWKDTEYPQENSLWMWIDKKDSRYLSRIALANRSGNLSLMLVPFYFSFVL